MYVFLRCSSLHNTNIEGTNTFDSSLSLELEVEVSSWIKLNGKTLVKSSSSSHIWEALLCIHLHLSIMWSSTSFKHVILRDSYLELALVNHDHQHLMSSSHRHLKYLSRCEPMRISSQKHRQHIVWVSTQSAIDNFLSYHKILCGASFALVCWPFRVQSPSFNLVNRYLYSMFNLDVLKGILNSSLE